MSFLIFQMLGFGNYKYKTELTFPTKKSNKSTLKSLIVITTRLIHNKCRKLKPHLVKSYFILIKNWMCQTNQQIVKL